MSYINQRSIRIIGGGSDPQARQVLQKNNQYIQESFTVTTSRKFKAAAGALNSLGYFTRTGAGSAPVGTLAFWGSNYPDPDESVDADWFLLAAPTAIDLSVINTNNGGQISMYFEWLRAKVTVTSGTVSLLLIVKQPELQ